MKEIPYGHCQCGCGGKPTLARSSDKKRGRIKGQPLKYMVGHNARVFHGMWTGGITDNGKGYIQIHCPGHPRATHNYVLEHVLIAEKAFGKYLPPGAVVHHANGTRNSGPLVICQDENYHKFLHQRMRAYKACGHAKWRKCWVCKQYDSPDKLILKNNHIYHASCLTEYRKNYKRKIKEEKALLLAGLGAMGIGRII